MNNFDFYVINLDKDSDRLKEIEKNLYPNKVIRISGIYGKEMNFENNNDIFFTSRYLVPKSTLGCGLSHQKAIKTFLTTSTKDYAVILEDDAIPNSNNYINEINEAINTAPSDWDLIKLDFTPKYSNNYNKHFSLLATSYIINKKGAEKFLNNKLFYHIDFDMNFYNLNLYNNRKIVFIQDWTNNKFSNNKSNFIFYNPFLLLSNNLSFKCIRIINTEFSFADLFLFLLLLVVFILNYNYIYKFISNKLELMKKISKTKF